MKRQSGAPQRRRADAGAADDRDNPFRAEKRMRRLEEAFEAGGATSSDDGDDTPPPSSGEGGGAADEEQEHDLSESSDDDADDDDDAPMEQQQRRVRRPVPQEEEDDEDDDDEADSSDEGDADANDDDDQEDALEPLEARVQRLSDLPLEQRERLLRDGSGPAGRAARDRARKALEAQRSLRRAHRDAPREMSSKRPVSRHREVLQVSREFVMGRDPRFPTAAEAPTAGGGGGGAKGQGRDDEAAARRRFAFLYDEAMPRERAELKGRLKREKSAARAAEIQERLAQVEQRLRDEAARRRRQQARDELKRGEQAAVAGGKKPYFPKKSEVRAAELVARYEELKKGGKLESYMEKRRRRNAAKDHRYLPSARRGE